MGNITVRHITLASGLTTPTATPLEQALAALMEKRNGVQQETRVWASLATQILIQGR